MAKGSKYQTSIVKKYKIVNLAEFADYMILDGMVEFISAVQNKNIILKGAAGLYLAYDYIRETGVTTDIDISVTTQLNETVNELENSLVAIEHEFYAFSHVKTTDLTIDVAGYSGKRIHIQVNIKGMTTKFKFSIDVSVEELRGLGLQKHESGIKVYVQERSLADKFVTFIQRGETNSREKDFIDFKFFFGSCDLKLLVDIVNRLIKVRKVSLEEIKMFIAEYPTNRFVIKYDLHKEIKKLLKALTS